MQSLGHSICTPRSQTGPLGEIMACPETDPFLYEWLSPTSLQQGQVGRMFKWHLVSNGVIITIIMIMTVAVITGAVAGVYQLFLSSCHFGQRFKVSEQKQQVTNTLWGADAMTGGELAPCQPHTYLSHLKRQAIQGLQAGDSHSVTSFPTLHSLWFVCNNLAQWFYVVVRSGELEMAALVSGMLDKGPAACVHLVLRYLALQGHLCEISPPNDERRAIHFQHGQPHHSL